MSTGHISQEQFNRICRQIRRAYLLPRRTNTDSLAASYISQQDEETTDILRNVFTYACALADRKRAVYADALNFWAYFRKLWLRVDPDRENRTQYIKAIQPFIDRGILTELFWSEHFSIVHFQNNAFGIFNSLSEDGCWHGAMLSESVLTSFAAEYLKYPDEYRQYRILDEAGMGLKRSRDIDKVIHKDYTKRELIYDDEGGCMYITTYPNAGTLYIPGIMVVQGYSKEDFSDVIKSIIAYNMDGVYKWAAFTFLKLREEMLPRYAGNLTLSDEAILYSGSPEGFVRLEQLSDTKRLGRYPDSDGEELKRLQIKYHGDTEGQAARIKAQQEKNARIEAYWSAHPGEKTALDQKEKQCREELSVLSERLRQYYQEWQNIENRYAKEQFPDVEQISVRIHQLSDSLNSISFLRRKKRKEVRNRIEKLKTERRAIELKAKNEGPLLEARKENELQKLETSWKPELKQKKKLDQKLAAVLAEKTKDRP